MIAVLALVSTVSLAAEPESPAPVSPAPAPLGPDRSAPPEVAPPTLLVMPEPARHPLPSKGGDALLVRAPGARKVSVWVMFRQGHVELGRAPDPTGVATAWLADTAAGKLSGAELSELADLHEVEVVSRMGHHQGGLALEVPLGDLTTGLDLQALVLRQASFPRRELKRYQIDQQQFYEVTGPRSQDRLAAAVLSFGWFPADHPYGTRPDLAGIDRLRPRDLRDRWQAWLRRAPIAALVVGDVAWDQVGPAVTAMVEGLGTDGPPGEDLPVAPPTASRVVAVHLPGQAQVALRMRLEAPGRDAPDAPAVTALDDILGGQFLSRLNRNLREDKGFTYGASSRYQRGVHWGSITVSVDVGANDLDATITEIEHELQRLVDEPVTEAELVATRRLLAADWNRTFETAADAMDRYASAVTAGWTMAQLQAHHQAVYDATAEDLQAAARTWLAPNRVRLWVIVADRELVGSALEDRGWNVQWVDPADAILGRF